MKWNLTLELHNTVIHHKFIVFFLLLGYFSAKGNDHCRTRDACGTWHWIGHEEKKCTLYIYCDPVRLLQEHSVISRFFNVKTFLLQKLSSSYYPGWQMASRVGISGYLLSRITGTIYVFYPTTRKWQLGLNLRFSRENSGVAGYTKLENREWSYSEAVEHILKEYWGKYVNRHRGFFLHHF